MLKLDPRLMAVLTGVVVAALGSFGFDQLRAVQDREVSQARDSSAKVADSVAPLARIDLEAEFQMAAIITLGTHLEHQVEKSYLEDRVLDAIQTLRPSAGILSQNAVQLASCALEKLNQNSNNYAVEAAQRCVIAAAQDSRRAFDREAANHDNKARMFARFVGLSQLVGVLIALVKDVLPGAASTASTLTKS